MCKYTPSIDAEARSLWNRFGALRQDGRTLVEHVNECTTVKNQITGLHLGNLIGRVSLPGESLHVHVAGSIVPMGIGHWALGNSSLCSWL